VRLWTDHDLPTGLRRSEVYERLRLPAERADILRLELLWRFGGVYVDTDFECLRPIDDLLVDVEFFVGDLKPGRTNNAILGAVPEHPLVGLALDQLRPADWHGQDPKDGTGPHFIDRLIEPRRREVTIFPPDVFYPSTDEERAQAYAIHHNARSWVDAEGLRYRLLKTEARLAETERALQRERGERPGGVRRVLDPDAGRV
jgi:mannosyltransferase OCH1-like enzyme